MEEAHVSEMRQNKAGRRWLWPTAIITLCAAIGGGFLFVHAATTTSSLWPNNTIPSTITSDAQSVELGTKFQSKVSGQVTGVRFYKGAQNTGVHTGSLWDNKGNLLATVTFTNETSSGWQTATFPQPITIAANVTYIISYHAPKGHYAASTNYFTKAYTNGDLSAPASSGGANGGNGVFTYGSKTAFPNSTYEASNYWVDVVFQSSLVQSSPSPAPPTSVTATQAQSTITVTWTASISQNPIAKYYVIRNGSTVATVSGSTLTYDDTNLIAGTTYAYQIEAIDNTSQVSALSPTATVTYNVTPPPPTNPTPDGVPGTWNLAFDDEFSDANVNLNNWQFTSGAETDCGQGNHENGQAEWVPVGSNGQSPNVTEASGLLTITAQRQKTSACGANFTWTSGRLVTKQAYGANTVVEIREQTNGMNNGSVGTWDGFWTWQAGGPQLANNGEIDGYEFWPPSNNTYNLSNHIGSSDAQSTVSDITQWHTVDIVLGSNSASWYIDGKLASTQAGGLGSSTVNVLLDQDVCGQPGKYNPDPCPGPNSAATSAALNIDYFRVWKQ